MTDNNNDHWKLLETMPQEEREVLCLAALFQGMKDGVITGKMLVDLMVSGRLMAGDVAPMIEILRNGRIDDLHPETLELLADHLEGKIERKPGPIKSKARFDRKIKIISSFLELKDEHGYDRALDMLAEDGSFSLGRKAIEKIISDFNKVEKQSQLALKVIQ
jgi:hypothetical protein